MLWHADVDMYMLPLDISGSILIIDHTVFWPMLQTSNSQQLIEFLNLGNKLWIFGSHDYAIRCSWKQNKQKIISLDKQIKKSSMLMLIESEMTDRFYLNNLNNIRVMSYTNWHFTGPVRPDAATLKKVPPHANYLLTMIIRKCRPHRHVLWQEMNRRPGLIDQGLVVVHHGDPSPEAWQGKVSHQHDFQAAHASMDLYSKCWLEIVPETCYRDLYFFTEKTHKPMMTRTPFLVTSTTGYLAWLQQQGFRTFHSLIDEGYDRHHRVEDRVRHMVDVLEDITRNGAESFYQASQDILDHNFSRLSEIAGSWHWQLDQVLWQALDDFRVRTEVPMPEVQCRTE